jgi:hypothetical protein
VPAPRPPPCPLWCQVPRTWSARARRSCRLFRRPRTPPVLFAADPLPKSFRRSQSPLFYRTRCPVYSKSARNAYPTQTFETLKSAPLKSDIPGARLFRQVSRRSSIPDLDRWIAVARMTVIDRAPPIVNDPRVGDRIRFDFPGALESLEERDEPRPVIPASARWQPVDRCLVPHWTHP